MCSKLWRGILVGILLGGLMGQTHAADIDLVVTIPDDMLTVIREVYGTAETPADDAKLQQVLQSVVAQHLRSVAANQLQNETTQIVALWERATAAQRQRIRQALRAVITQER